VIHDSVIVLGHDLAFGRFCGGLEYRADGQFLSMP
jgi:hypothetical protein